MIRAARMEDLEQVTRLFNDYRVWYEKESDLSGAELFIKTRLLQNDSVIFVSEENGLLNGFTQLYPLFSSTRMRKSWLLNDLFVSPEFRGKGISKALLEAAKVLCTKTDAAGLLLETQKTNIIGNQLYPAAGFELYDENNFYWWANTN
jgi:GNAT superfamily N-acetyltransferase